MVLAIHSAIHSSHAYHSGIAHQHNILAQEKNDLKINEEFNSFLTFTLIYFVLEWSHVEDVFSWLTFYFTIVIKMFFTKMLD